MMKKFQLVLLILICVGVGVVVGGYLFSESQPRSFLAIRNCERCFSPSELAGLLGSVVVQKFPGLIPFVVHETDKSIAFKLPFSRGKAHYLVVPKKDIRDIGDISEEDLPYLADAFLVMGQIIRENKLVNYWMETNGPGYQNVTYLHFHLFSGEGKKMHGAQRSAAP